MDTDRMLKWFRTAEMADDIRDVSDAYFGLACKIVKTCHSGAERTVALRKLLESRDAAIRARLHPGG